MQILLADLRHALRQLWRTPGFVLIALLTLALGVGANAAIFSVVNAIVLRPLPYPDAGRLVFITSQFPSLGFNKFWVSPPEYFEIQERQRAFTAIGGYTIGANSLTTPDRARRVVTAVVTPELMQVLGVGPARGRLLNAQDAVLGGPQVVMLSHDLWASGYARDEGVIGRQIEIDGGPATVVGIMPAGFDVGDARAELFRPLRFAANARQARGNHFLYLVGRLKPDMTIDRARAELETMLAQWGTITPNTHVPSTTNHRLQYAPLHEEIVGPASRAVWVLQAAVGFVLLIACANLANLLLARAETRQREFATRLALGAGRGRLLRQFVTEGVLLSVAGGVIGLVIALVGVPAMVQAYRESLPRALGISIDVPVMLFTLAVSLITGVVFGFAPLLHLAGDVTAHALREGTTRTTTGVASNRLRRLLVMGEVALAVVLVFGAGLMLRSIWNLSRVDAGFDRGQLVTFGMSLPSPQVRYQQPAQAADFYARLTSALEAIPGVQRAAVMSGLPPLRQVDANDTDIEGYTAPEKGPFENVDFYQRTTVDYVETLGIPVLEGRSFQPSDREGGPVMLINETMAKTFWKDRSPLGARLNPSGNANPVWYTVVGVLKDVKQGGVDQKTGTELYMLIDQTSRLQKNPFAPRTVNVVLRTTLPVASLDGQVRQIVQRLDPSVPVVRLRQMEDVFVDSTLRSRLLAQLLTAFGGLALLLAALGTYGLLSYLVTERRREIGIRMALGAERGRVLAMVMRQGFVLTLAGVIVGVFSALLMTRVMQSFIFGVTTWDPATLAAVLISLGVVAAAACYIPARRATRVDPMVVLRQD